MICRNLSASKDWCRQRYILAISRARHSGDSEWLSRKASSNILKPPVQKVIIVFFLYACHTAKRPLDQIFQKIIADIMYQLCVASLMSVPNHNDTFIESANCFLMVESLKEVALFVGQDN